MLVIALVECMGHALLLFGGYCIDWATMVPCMHLYATYANLDFAAGYLMGAISQALALRTVAPILLAKASWWASAVAMLAFIFSASSHGT